MPPTLTRTPDAELERLAETAPEPARTLATGLLHTRRQVVRIRGLLGVYSERTVERAYQITEEILGE